MLEPWGKVARKGHGCPAEEVGPLSDLEIDPQAGQKLGDKRITSKGMGNSKTVSFDFQLRCKQMYEFQFCGGVKELLCVKTPASPNICRL